MGVWAVIYSVTGKLMEKTGDTAVVECSGVAFGCLTSLSTLASLPPCGEVVTLYTHLYVREGAMDLYGFAGKGELAYFRMLLTVSGVGPKAALAVLSAMSPEKLALAVAAGDSKALTAAQGIGKKTAERMILELRDKVGSQDIAGGFSGAGAAAPVIQGNLSEAVNALIVLGYSQMEAAQALQGFSEEETVEELIRQGLRRLAGGKQ